MGCATSKSVGPLRVDGGDELTVLLIRAMKLRDADFIGTSDPYAVMRVGPCGSKFEEKPEETERLTCTVFDTTNPEWNLAVRFPLPNGANPSELELHVVVVDQDVFTADDSLGEARLTVSDLIATASKSKSTLITKELRGSKATGVIELMVGSAVESTCLQQLEARGSEDDPELSWWSSLGQYWSRTSEDLEYSLNGVKLLIAQGKEGGLPFPDFFFSRATTDAAGKRAWHGGMVPGDTVTYVDHADVAGGLANFVQRLGTTNENAEVYRENFLGFIRLTTVGWPELDDPAIALSASTEVHAALRPVMIAVLGAESKFWSRETIAASTAAFFKDRTKIDVKTDFEKWLCKDILHGMLLGLEITDSEAESFMKMRALATPLGESAMRTKIVRKALGIDKALETKAKFLEKYKKILPVRFKDEVAGLSELHMKILASALVDALLFAALPSVPRMIGLCFGLQYSQWGVDNLSEDARTLTESKLWTYTMETVRRFPPVAGFGYRERMPTATVKDTDGSPYKSEPRVFLSILNTSFDKKVWGEDADAFVLRPDGHYHEKMMTWADAALVDGDVKHPNSHQCPAKDLSINLIVEMTRAWLHSTVGAEAAAAGTPLNLNVWKCSQDPKKIRITGKGVASEFTLERASP